MHTKVFSYYTHNNNACIALKDSWNLYQDRWIAYKVRGSIKYAELHLKTAELHIITIMRSNIIYKGCWIVHNNAWKCRIVLCSEKKLVPQSLIVNWLHIFLQNFFNKSNKLSKCCKIVWHTNIWQQIKTSLLQHLLKFKFSKTSVALPVLCWIQQNTAILCLKFYFKLWSNLLR